GHLPEYEKENEKEKEKEQARARAFGPVTGAGIGSRSSSLRSRFWIRAVVCSASFRPPAFAVFSGGRNDAERHDCVTSRKAHWLAGGLRPVSRRSACWNARPR